MRAMAFHPLLTMLATQVLQVRESEVRSFRSLTSSICLSEALAIGFAFEKERAGRANGRKRAVKTQ